MRQGGEGGKRGKKQEAKIKMAGCTKHVGISMNQHLSGRCHSKYKLHKTYLRVDREER